MTPGEIIPGVDPVVINQNRPAVALVVANTGDRPVQVGSHFHFAQANPALSFDRASAWGHRLDVAAGAAVRFEPGVEREVTLVALAGARTVPGLQIGEPKLRAGGAPGEARIASSASDQEARGRTPPGGTGTDRG